MFSMSWLLFFTCFSSLDSCNNISLCVSAYSLSFVNTLMIRMFTSMATSLFKTQDSIATPCSVNAFGSFLLPPHFLDVAFCDFKFSYSLAVRVNIKSLGKRLKFLFTCSFDAGSPPYTSEQDLHPILLFVLSQHICGSEVFCSSTSDCNSLFAIAYILTL